MAGLWASATPPLASGRSISVRTSSTCNRWRRWAFFLVAIALVPLGLAMQYLSTFDNHIYGTYRIAAASAARKFYKGGTNKGKCEPPKDGEPPRDDIVLVVMCNKSQAARVAKTVREVRTIGKYTGDVVVMHSEDDLPEASAFTVFSDLHVRFKSFPRNIDKYTVPEDLPGHGPAGRGINQDTAWVYFMKFNVFDPYFAERWCRVLYLDGGIKAFGDVPPYLNSVYPTEKLYAHSDSYPSGVWKLSGQFSEIRSHPKTKGELAAKYNLEVDYPQSTLLYFNTQTVVAGDPGVTDKLFDLQRNYPIGKRLDQAYIALYYTKLKPIWEELPEDEANGRRFFDYCDSRAGKPPVLLAKSKCK